MGAKGIDRCGCLIQSRRHWICGRKTIDKQRTGNGEFDLLNVIEDLLEICRTAAEARRSEKKNLFASQL